MNKQLKIALIVIGSLIIVIGSLAYGAMTAPSEKQVIPVATIKPVTKSDLASQLTEELPTITGVLDAANPKIQTDYTLDHEQLYDQGQWFGATLTYHGNDTLNRDTLRVLMQKKNAVWVLRTSPPMLILSASEYPDVPRSILSAINQPVGLPN